MLCRQTIHTDCKLKPYRSVNRFFLFAMQALVFVMKLLASMDPHALLQIPEFTNKSAHPDVTSHLPVVPLQSRLYFRNPPLMKQAKERFVPSYFRLQIY